MIIQREKVGQVRDISKELAIDARLNFCAIAGWN